MPGTVLASARRRRRPAPELPLCSVCRAPVELDGPLRPVRLRVTSESGAMRPGPFVHAGRCECALVALEVLRRGFCLTDREERSAEELASVLLELWRHGPGPHPADVLASVRARLVELGRDVDEPVLLAV